MLLKSSQVKRLQFTPSQPKSSQLKQTPITQGNVFTITDDQMIEKFDVKQVEGFFYPISDGQIALAGLRYSWRVIMGDYHGGGVMGQYFFYEFPGMNRSAA